MTTASPQPRKDAANEPGVDLASLNHLLHWATGSDPALAAQLESAIAFSRQAGESRDLSELDEAARRLVELHLDGRRDVGFAHCDLRGADDDPLFLRPSVMRALRQVGGCREAIVLVTGLRRSVCPPGRYFTSKRQQHYSHAQAFIEDLAAKYTARKTRLQLVFV